LTAIRFANVHPAQKYDPAHWKFQCRGDQGAISNSLPNKFFSTRLRKWS
jgi:hypothetical protein